MKIKLSWIPFIPVAVLSVVLRVYQLLFVENGVDTGFLSSRNGGKEIKRKYKDIPLLSGENRGT